MHLHLVLLKAQKQFTSDHRLDREPRCCARRNANSDHFERRYVHRLTRFFSGLLLRIETPRVIVLGIDVGGTHTDAALMDDGRFVDGVKVSSSKDVHRSILNALDMLTERQPDLIEQLDLISLGTTQFTNAVVERRRWRRSLQYG